MFVPRSYHLSAADEKAQYDLHENDPNDPGYRAFLDRLAGPLDKRLAPHSHGLDFGCGPGPTLSVMLEEHRQDQETTNELLYQRNAIAMARQAKEYAGELEMTDVAIFDWDSIFVSVFRV